MWLLTERSVSSAMTIGGAGVVEVRRKVISQDKKVVIGNVAE